MRKPITGALLLLLAGCAGHPGDPLVPDDTGRAGDGRLDAVLESIRSASGVPAVGALLVAAGAVLETGAAGRRAEGFPERVTVHDQWHIGSLTKSMTSTLAARLVERGLISWSTSVGEVFPDLVGSMQAQYAPATLAQLLTHTAGMPVDVTRAPSWSSLRADPAPIMEARRRFAAELLAIAPEAARGSFLYSNAGYIVAGAMLEELTGDSWEDLMRAEILTPLGMRATGFGAPGEATSRNQPWGHARQSGSWRAIAPGPDADNPLALGPAGTVHTSFEDFARYLAAHLAGAQRTGGIVSIASFDRLHTPAAGTASAMGWGVADRGWARGDALMHAGSNTLWYAIMAVAPARDVALLAVTNVGGDQGRLAADAVVQALVNRLEGANR